MYRKQNAAYKLANPLSLFNNCEHHISLQLLNPFYICEMEKINARVLLIMDKLGKSKSELAREISVSPSIMSHITSGRNKVGLDVLQKIGEVYPQISSQWLLHGAGNMFEEADKDGDCKITLKENQPITAHSEVT